MLKIRLQRVGRKHDPSYRIVLTDSRKAPQSGAFSEILGSYDPRKPASPQGGKESAAFNLKKERIEHWISKGAQTTGVVHNLLVSEKIIKGPKVKVSPSAKETAKEKSVPPHSL